MTPNTVAPQNALDVIDLVTPQGIAISKFHIGIELQSLVSLAACKNMQIGNVEMCNGIHHKGKHQCKKKTSMYPW